MVDELTRWLRVIVVDKIEKRVTTKVFELSREDEEVEVDVLVDIFINCL